MKSSSDQPMQTLIFNVGEAICAVDMAHLTEVAEPVSATPLPFVPPFVDGLINHAGQIMPQINAMRLLETSCEHLKTLLALEFDGIALGLLVNQVLETAEPDAATLIHDEASHPYRSAQFVWREQPVQLLDVEKLTLLIRASKQAAGKPGFLGKLKDVHEQQEIQHDMFLFRLGEKDYAFALAEVDEIIELHSLNALPRAPQLIAGLSLVRTEPRIILNISSLLGDHEYGDGQVAVVVDIGPAYAGLLIDKLIGIESISERLIRTSRDAKQQTLERANGEFVPVLKVADLLGPHLLTILPFLPSARKQDRRVAVKEIDMLRFIVNGDVYAFPIRDVQRVVTDKRIEPILSEQAWIIGTTEIEGKVIPVVDLIAQLGYQSRREKLREFIVVSDGKSDWALATHTSEQIVAINENTIDWIDSEAANYVSAFININEQLMTVLNPVSICLDNQRRQQ